MRDLQRTVAPARVRARGWGWRHASRSRWALDGLDLEISPGERVLLLGSSGSGKSTFLHALAGVQGGAEDGEYAGSLEIDGMPPAHARGRAGLVLQDPDSQVILSRVGDDVAFGCENLGIARDEIWKRARVALDSVGLEVPFDRASSGLSGGQKQRLALAGAIAMRPGLLLLDEPTANLDPAGVAEVRRAVARTLDETGATFIVVEHRVDVWVDLVNRVIVLGRDGAVLADGAPHDVLVRARTELLDAGVWVPGEPVPAALRLERSTDDEYASDRPIMCGDDLSLARRPGEVVRSQVSLELSAGRSTVLTGANGSGKSTLALTLGGLLKPAAGRVRVAEALAVGARGTSPIAWRSRELLTRIGTVFQEPEHQFVASTVRSELAVGPRALGLVEHEATARADAVMERLGLSKLADANPFTLSGGEQRRLSVASVLAVEPRVVILDEPTFGQDRLTWIELVRLLGELVGDGLTLLSATHDAAYVDALGQRSVLLGDAAPAIQESRR